MEKDTRGVARLGMPRELKYTCISIRPLERFCDFQICMWNAEGRVIIIEGVALHVRFKFLGYRYIIYVLRAISPVMSFLPFSSQYVY